MPGAAPGAFGTVIRIGRERADRVLAETGREPLAKLDGFGRLATRQEAAIVCGKHRRFLRGQRDRFDAPGKLDPLDPRTQQREQMRRIATWRR